MTEQELLVVLQSFKDSLQMLEAKIDQLDQYKISVEERINSLQSMIFDDIINPAKTAMENADRQERYDGFYDRNGEKLDGYNNALRTIERDENFSLAKQAFDNYEALEEPKMEEAEFVDKLVEKVEAQLNDIKASLNLPDDTEITAELNEDGEVTIEAEGEEVASTNDEVTTEETSTEEAPAEEAPAEETTAEEVPEEEPIVDSVEPEEVSEEELEELRKEAEAALRKAGKLPGRN